MKNNINPPSFIHNTKVVITCPLEDRQGKLQPFCQTMLNTWPTKALFLNTKTPMRKYNFIRWSVSSTVVFSMDVSLYSTHAEKSVFENIWLCVLTVYGASPSEIIINYLFKAHWNISLSIPYLTFLTVAADNTCF